MFTRLLRPASPLSPAPTSLTTRWPLVADATSSPSIPCHHVCELLLFISLWTSLSLSSSSPFLPPLLLAIWLFRHPNTNRSHPTSHLAAQQPDHLVHSTTQRIVLSDHTITVTLISSHSTCFVTFAGSMAPLVTCELCPLVPRACPLVTGGGDEDIEAVREKRGANLSMVA
jgi:hypothetical protein